MKSHDSLSIPKYAVNPATNFGRTLRQPGRLHLVTVHEVESLRRALVRGQVPPDFEAKLTKLTGGSLLHRAVEQNCRIFIALLQASYDGSFVGAGQQIRERLLRVLAYVRKDDDAIPDYKPCGFEDDQEEVRAAAKELNGLIQRFKAWRLRYQVPALWRDEGRGEGFQTRHFSST